MRTVWFQGGFYSITTPFGKVLPTHEIRETQGAPRTHRVPWDHKEKPRLRWSRRWRVSLPPSCKESPLSARFSYLSWAWTRWKEKWPRSWRGLVMVGVCDVFWCHHLIKYGNKMKFVHFLLKQCKTNTSNSMQITYHKLSQIILTSGSK